jgi:hypothetical protein
VSRRAATVQTVVALGWVVAACASEGSRATPDARAALPGGTGSFAIVPAGDTQKLYLPQYGTATAAPSIAVVDIAAKGNGVDGAPGLLASIALESAGDADYATTTAGDSTIVVAASTVSPRIWFIDPATDTVVDSLQLDASYGQSTSGGDGGYVTSVALDSARRRAFLAVWNGIAVVDLTTRKIERTISAPPSENIAFDPGRQWILAPFYDCVSSLDSRGNAPSTCKDPRNGDGAVITDGLSVIDVKSGAVHTFLYADSQVPGEPVGATPGSAAIDPESGLAIVTSKARQYQTIIDFSRATFDDRAHTVEAPTTILRGNGLTDVAIAPPGHLAFWEGENAADVAAARLPTLAPAAAAGDGSAPVADAGPARTVEPDYVFGRIASTPDGAPWMNVVSSHGVAVWPGSAGKGAYGVTISEDYRWAARVDLQALLALPAEYHEVTDVSSAVTLLDARARVPRTAGDSSP